MFEVCVIVTAAFKYLYFAQTNHLLMLFLVYKNRELVGMSPIILLPTKFQVYTFYIIALQYLNTDQLPVYNKMVSWPSNL